MKLIKMRLETNSIKKAIKELEQYRDSLSVKSELLVNRLIDAGISVAYQHLGRYTGYVEFTKDVENQGSRTIGVLTGKDTKPFISAWKYKGSVKTVEVSGILMSEFGSGWLANVRWNVAGVGQGTFPGQIHATDPDGWYWTDTSGTKHHSIGETPNYPMYYADMEMLKQIDTIAKEVFGNDI